MSPSALKKEDGAGSVISLLGCTLVLISDSTKGGSSEEDDVLRNGEEWVQVPDEQKELEVGRNTLSRAFFSEFFPQCHYLVCF